MEFINIKQASQKWGINERRIRQLVQNNRIIGAIKVGNSWNIPSDATKPIDRRRSVTIDFEADIKNDILERIEEKRKIIMDNNFKISDAIKKEYILEWIYNSNSIEESTLTLEEMKTILGGIAIGGKSIKEHMQVINNKDAINYFEKMIKKNENLNETDIKMINNLLMKEINDEEKGKYRVENIYNIINTTIQRNIIAEQMEQLLLRYNEWCEDYYLIVAVTFFYGEFMRIRPFSNGNGLTARILINYNMIKSGYAPIIIRNELKSQYEEALKDARTKEDYTNLLELFAKEEERMLDLYLKNKL